MTLHKVNGVSVTFPESGTDASRRKRRQDKHKRRQKERALRPPRLRNDEVMKLG
jgi:hypothetical protein